MANWDYYAVTAKSMDPEERHIIMVQVRIILDGPGYPDTWSRERVIEAISAGKTFMTYFYQGGEWKPGKKIHIVEIGGVPYIRTDRNDIASDNLSELPDF